MSTPIDRFAKGANEGPSKKDWEKARELPCTCEACAERYGDQADPMLVLRDSEVEAAVRRAVEDTIEECAALVERLPFGDQTLKEIAGRIRARRVPKL